MNNLTKGGAIHSTTFQTSWWTALNFYVYSIENTNLQIKSKEIFQPDRQTISKYEKESSCHWNFFNNSPTAYSHIYHYFKLRPLSNEILFFTSSKASSFHGWCLSMSIPISISIASLPFWSCSKHEIFSSVGWVYHWNINYLSFNTLIFSFLWQCREILFFSHFLFIHTSWILINCFQPDEILISWNKLSYRTNHVSWGSSLTFKWFCNFELEHRISLIFFVWLDTTVTL